MDISTQIQEMKANLDSLQDDVTKHGKGQKAAGTRIRQAMQSIKGQAQEVRVTVLNDQKS